MKKRFALLLLLVLAFLLVAQPQNVSALTFLNVGTLDYDRYLLTFEVKSLPDSQVVLFFDYKDDNNHFGFQFWEGKVYLLSKQNGVRKVIAKAPVPEGMSGKIYIKRHTDSVSLIFEQRALIYAKIGPQGGTIIGYGVEGSGDKSPFAFTKYQPLGDVYFRDSFMRNNSPGEWQIVSGLWEICGLGFAERSSNPFSIFARFKDSDDLEPLEKGRLLEEQIGIGVNLSPSGSIVRINSQGPASEAGLQQDDIILKVNGEDIRRRWRDLENATPGEKFKLVIRRGRETFEVTVTARRYSWGKIEKRFRLEPAVMSSKALMISGFKFWDDYTYSASVKPMGEGSVGLVFYYIDENNYYALQWYGSNEQRNTTSLQLRVIRVLNGKETVLKTVNGGFYPSQYYEMKISVEGTNLKCFVDSFVVAELASDGLCMGKIGLIATEGYGAYFDDVQVASNYVYEEKTRTRNLNRIYKAQGDMRSWSDPSRDWRRSFRKGGPVYTSLYDFFGPVSIEVSHKTVFTELDIEAYFSNEAEGHHFVFDKGKQEARIIINDKMVMSKAVKGFANDVDFTIHADRKGFSIIQCDEELVSLSAGSEAKGSLFRVTGITGMIIRDEVLLTICGKESVRDYTFEECPTDWFVNDGKWGVMNKWICDPRWSWFGGINLDGKAGISSKFELEGDYSVDVFLATMMLVNDPPYEMLGNYCISTETDGKNAPSGYTFFVAGGMNYWVGVAKGKELEYKKTRYSEKTQNDDHMTSFLPVDNRLMYQGNEVVHQRWYHAKVVRRGDTLEYYFEGRLVHSTKADKTDAGKRLMLWVYRNGWVISRLRVCAQNIVASRPEFSEIKKFDHLGWNNEGQLRPRVLLNEDKQGKLLSGEVVENGPFFISSGYSGINIEEHPSVEFNLSLSKGTKADLYFTYAGSDYRVNINGIIQDDNVYPTVGNLRFPDDGKIHHVVIPISVFLRDYFGQRLNEKEISNIRFGQLVCSGYSLAGFGEGNWTGNSFKISALELIEAGQAKIEKVDAFPNGSAQIDIYFGKTGCYLDFSSASVVINGEQEIEIAEIVPIANGLGISILFDKTLSFKKGQEIQAKLEKVSDLSGIDVEVNIPKISYKLASDTSKPVIIDWVPGIECLGSEDFEKSFSTTQKSRNPEISRSTLARMVRDFSTSSSGRASIKLSSEAIGSLMKGTICYTNTHIPTPKVIVFDYLMDRDVPISLSSTGDRSCFRFNDPQVPSPNFWNSGKEVSPRRSLADFPTPIVDGKWHTTFAPLKASEGSYSAMQNLSIVDFGFRGGYIHDWVNFDNVKIMEITGVLKRVPKLVVSELGEITEVRSSISEEPEEPEGEWKPGMALPKTSCLKLYYNVKVKDAAGNWSDTRSFIFFCDSAAPRITSHNWKTRYLTVMFSDNTMIDKTTVELELPSGEKIEANSKDISFKAKSGGMMLTVRREFKVKKITVTISDIYGNVGKYRVTDNKVVALYNAEEL